MRLFTAAALIFCACSVVAQPTPLQRALEPLHAQYDPAAKMLRRPFSSPGYHTTLTGGDVHPTRDSLHYAVACLATRDPALVRRACDIIDKVISLQDQNPAHNTYGIWSWFLEEPLDKMSPPDWNWADFCGRALLQVELRHRDQIPSDLRERIKSAILHAARSVHKRNVGPGYTNIAVLGTYVTLVAGETFADEPLTRYGIDRLKKFADYTDKTGGFTEYNSPTYTLITLYALAHLRQDAKDARSRQLADTLYRRAWTEFATHFHAPTRQWGAPHSRAYSTLLRDQALALVQRGTDGRVDFGQSNAPANLEILDIATPCPPDLEPLFTRLDAPRTVTSVFVKSDNPFVGTTYLHPQFSLGTVNRGDLWNQRRPVVGYFGTADKPGYLQVRMLKNNYDLAAANIFAVQKEGHVLVAITFATDGGDTHISLNKLKDAKFNTNDLRFRIELGGPAAPTDVTIPSVVTAPIEIRSGPVTIRLTVPHASFGTFKPRWETTRNRDALGVDLVLHSGSETTIDLAKIRSAVIGFVVEMTSTVAPPATTDATVDAARLSMSSGPLRLSVPVAPDKQGVLQKSFRATITE